MTEASDKIRFRRGGLFAKYVVLLVGLVVFVLAVNGGLEIWISYQETKATLSSAMSEKAATAARRLEQSMSDLERQISWVTRASVKTIEQRRDDYVQLLNQVPAIGQLFHLDGSGRQRLSVTRSAVLFGSAADFSRDLRFTEAVSRGVNFAPATLRDGRPSMSISVAHSDAGVTVAEIDLRFLSDLVGDAQAGRIGTAYIVDPRGIVLAS